MTHKEDLTKDIEKLKETMQKELQDMYMKGCAAGAVSTCGILYKTFLLTGLEETNILFAILKDIAAKNGCQDLPAYIQNMGNKDKN